LLKCGSCRQASYRCRECGDLRCIHLIGEIDRTKDPKNPTGCCGKNACRAAVNARLAEAAARRRKGERRFI